MIASPDAVLLYIPLMKETIMTWEEIIKESKWPKYITKDKKRYLLFKVIG